jgi:hypothetical protein
MRFFSSLFGIPSPIAYRQMIQRYFGAGRSLLFMLILSLSLTGCVDAKTSIHFDSPQHGQLTQHIRLGSQLANAQGWLNQVERQAKRLNGKVDRPSRQELNFTLAFNGAPDLATKFNQLFDTHSDSPNSSEMATIPSNLTVATSNLLLFDRHRLTYNIDLSSLGLQADNGDPLFDAGEALNWDFGVSGPWGTGSGRSNIDSQKQSSERIWALQPGKPNHIEAIVWMPNPIGWGTALIAGIVVAGTYYSRQTS